MHTFEEFVKAHNPKLIEGYEFYKAYINNPESLLNRQVIAITYGFGCGSYGGTEMVIYEIDGNHVRLRNLINSNDTYTTELDKLPFKVRFIENK